MPIITRKDILIIKDYSKDLLGLFHLDNKNTSISFLDWFNNKSKEYTNDYNLSSNSKKERQGILNDKLSLYFASKNELDNRDKAYKIFHPIKSKKEDELLVACKKDLLNNFKITNEQLDAISNAFINNTQPCDINELGENIEAKKDTLRSELNLDYLKLKDETTTISKNDLAKQTNKAVIKDDGIKI